VKTERVLSVSKPRSAAAALRSRVVEAAAALFLNRGFVRVTADDIAARLGISKATLYKVFHGKEDILRAVVRGYLAQVLARVERLIADGSLGFVEKMVALLTLLGDQMARLEPVLVRDLQKHAPGIWGEIEAFRQEKIGKNFRVILESGRREGFFREDVDLDLLLGMFAGLVREFVNPAALLRSGRSAAETFESVIKVFFQGILTDKGRRDFSARTPALFRPRKEGAS
jgi:AcrR family transcriptional regulator